jgi:hypothetical protein
MIQPLWAEDGEIHQAPFKDICHAGMPVGRCELTVPVACQPQLHFTRSRQRVTSPVARIYTYMPSGARSHSRPCLLQMALEVLTIERHPASG